MRLITELTEDVGSLVVEYAQGQKRYYIEGPFIQSEIQNRNGRRYPRAMMEQVVGDYIKEKVNTRRALGELNHPTSPTVDPERACHLIESLTQEGNDWIGKAKVLTGNPMGDIVKGLIEHGVNFGVSTRGIGSLKSIGGITEVQNYKMSTAADVVSDPSAPNAFVQGIMENVEWIYDASKDQLIQQALEDTKKDLHRNWKQFDEAKALSLFENFLKKFS